MPTPDAAPVREGDILAGKYRVERVLGAGGMGVVVAATHLRLGTRVAIKFLLPTSFASTGAADRFLREARAAARIESDHVVRVIDSATLESGAPYMVMELLRGTDLAAQLRAHGPLGVETAVDYVLQACEAIAHAHAMGIVHRDLKPSNLFLATKADGTRLVKVLDFGISKAMPTATSLIAAGGATDTSSSLGSPLYMSPEQVRSAKNVDLRTDIWSLGVVLYELLAGRTPFLADSLMAVCVAIANDPPVSLRDRRPEVPEGLEAVVRRCLEKDREKRFASVEELTRALAPFAPAGAQSRVERVARIGAGPPPSDVSALAATLAAPDAAEARVATQGAWSGTSSDRRRALPWILLAGAGLLVIGGFARRALDRRPGHAPGPAASSAAALDGPPAPAIQAQAPIDSGVSNVEVNADAAVPASAASAVRPPAPTKPGSRTPPRGTTTKTTRDGTEEPY